MNFTPNKTNSFVQRNTFGQRNDNQFSKTQNVFFNQRKTSQNVTSKKYGKYSTSPKSQHKPRSSYDNSFNQIAQTYYHKQVGANRQKNNLLLPRKIYSYDDDQHEKFANEQLSFNTIQIQRNQKLQPLSHSSKKVSNISQTKAVKSIKRPSLIDTYDI